MGLRRALVVGINDYPFKPLKACVNDADAISKVLQYNEDCTENFTITKLTDADVDTRGKLKRSIRDCFDGKGEVALFYFAGHGFIDEIGSYIVTPDCSVDDEGIFMEEVLAIVNKSMFQSKVVILDCCHSGDFGSKHSTGQAAIIHDGVTILTACSSNESAEEINGHGVFTALLLEALQGGAADVLGYITPGSIYAYIDRALGQGEQRPIFKTNVSSFSPLRKVKPPVDKNVLRHLAHYFAKADSEYQLDPTFEFTDSSAVPENILIFKELQLLERVGLVVPCDEEHMYFAAMHSKSCKLTVVGRHYWRLAKENRI